MATSGRTAAGRALPVSASLPILTRHFFLDAPVDHRVPSPETPVFGEGAKDHTRGRVCSPSRLRRPAIDPAIAAGWQAATGTTTVTDIDEDWERVEIEQSVGATRFFRVIVGL